MPLSTAPPPPPTFIPGAWERCARFYTEVPFSPRENRADVCLRYRTNAYEAALEHPAGSSAAAIAAGDYQARLAELHRRCDRWRDRFGALSSTQRAILIGLPVAALLFVGRAGVLTLTFFTVGLLILIFRAQRFEGVYRFVDAINHRLCPTCRYDLADAPDAIAPEHAAGAHTGPRVCPECGTGWPLLPPPA